jgi:hypothetical protein
MRDERPDLDVEDHEPVTAVRGFVLFCCAVVMIGLATLWVQAIYRNDHPPASPPQPTVRLAPAVSVYLPPDEPAVRIVFMRGADDRELCELTFRGIFMLRSEDYRYVCRIPAE